MSEQPKAKEPKGEQREVNLNQIDWRAAAVDPKTGVWTLEPSEGYPAGKIEYRVYFENEWYVVLGWLDARAISDLPETAEMWVEKLNEYLERRSQEH